ncbi:carbohydrate ABC transporter permease [Neobacillus jeddahensis]|uniref:carbohydrate ABC transporter permease n=1 Tax=Neobacillus jeddahensis TaxID=1461580 RepID=UPI00058FF8C9|nr:sugar ABC transporter permease [Neobacillus jeddahensis]
MKRRGNRKKRIEALTAYGFLLPNLVGLTVFVFVPMVYAFYVSLNDWNLLTPKVFIGFDNYIQMSHDKDWWQAVGRTFKFTIIYVPSLFCLSLFFAAVCNSLSQRVENVTRTLFLLPFAITSVISAAIWMFLYDPKDGIINQFLNLVGIDAQQFLGSTSQAMISIIVVVIWINLGYNMMIFLASMKEIPGEFYEAAKIDGATGWKAFQHITFPLLRETSVFILVVTTIGSFQVFDQIMVMTKGGPANSTQVGVLYIYHQAFEVLNMGYASALSVVLFLIIFILSLVQLRLTAKKD